MTKRVLSAGVAVALAILASACGSSSSDSSSTSSASSSPPLRGAGSSLILPLVAKWQAGYEQSGAGTVDYRAIPNGVDTGPLAAGAVDFIAADAPATPEQFGEVPSPIEMIPWALSATVILYNLDGVADLRLSGDVLADIWMGKVSVWDDPAIAALNPGASLPSTPITLVDRSDENGDDYVLTNYLFATDDEFSEKIGIARQIEFPGGVAAKKDGGVAATVARVDGAIGYVSLPYALANDLENVALIENKAGNFPEPSVKSVGAAARAQSRIGPNLETSIAELPPSAKDAYPISAYAYAIVPLDSKRAADLKKFIAYAISPEAQAQGAALGFAPLPPKVIAADKRAIAVIGTY